MSKSRAEKPAPGRKEPAASRLWRAAGFILRLPRILRVGLVLLFSAAVALDIAVLFYQIDPGLVDSDLLYLPVGVALIFGFAMYGVGWLALVWTGGNVPPSEQVAAAYIGVGVLSVGVALFWLVQVIVTWSTPF